MAIINNLEELKQLIKLAKEEKIQAIKVDGVEFALYPDVKPPEPQPEVDEEDLLFASAN